MGLQKMIDKYVQMQKDGFEFVSIAQVLSDLRDFRPLPREARKEA